MERGERVPTPGRTKGSAKALVNTFRRLRTEVADASERKRALLAITRLRELSLPTGWPLTPQSEGQWHRAASCMLPSLHPGCPHPVCAQPIQFRAQPTHSAVGNHT